MLSYINIWILGSKLNSSFPFFSAIVFWEGNCSKAFSSSQEIPYPSSHLPLWLFPKEEKGVSLVTGPHCIMDWVPIPYIYIYIWINSIYKHNQGMAGLLDTGSIVAECSVAASLLEIGE